MKYFWLGLALSTCGVIALLFRVESTLSFAYQDEVREIQLDPGPILRDWPHLLGESLQLPEFKDRVKADFAQLEIHPVPGISDIDVGTQVELGPSPTGDRTVVLRTTLRLPKIFPRRFSIRHLAPHFSERPSDLAEAAELEATIDRLARETFEDLTTVWAQRVDELIELRRSDLALCHEIRRASAGRWRVLRSQHSAHSPYRKLVEHYAERLEVLRSMLSYTHLASSTRPDGVFFSILEPATGKRRIRLDREHVASEAALEDRLRPLAIPKQASEPMPPHRPKDTNDHPLADAVAPLAREHSVFLQIEVQALNRPGSPSDHETSRASSILEAVLPLVASTPVERIRFNEVRSSTGIVGYQLALDLWERPAKFRPFPRHHAIFVADQTSAVEKIREWIRTHPQRGTPEWNRLTQHARGSTREGLSFAEETNLEFRPFVSRSTPLERTIEVLAALRSVAPRLKASPPLHFELVGDDLRVLHESGESLQLSALPLESLGTRVVAASDQLRSERGDPTALAARRRRLELSLFGGVTAIEFDAGPRTPYLSRLG